MSELRKVPTNLWSVEQDFAVITKRDAVTFHIEDLSDSFTPSPRSRA